MLRKVVAYYLKNRKQNFGYDLKLLSFLKTQHKIYKESTHFQKFIFIQKWFLKNMSCTGTTISILNINM
jgi:hypothetical protein